MTNRDKFSWPDVEPDVSVEMTLLYDRGKKDDGTSGNGDKKHDWHRYPVKVGKQEFSMFTPHDRMHQILQELGVTKRGTIFHVTKKLGWNQKTKKPFTFYEIESGNRMMSTQNGSDKPTSQSPAADQPIDGALKIPESEVSVLVEQTLAIVVHEFQRYCPAAWQDPEKRPGYLIEMFRYAIPMVSTQLINRAHGRRDNWQQKAPNHQPATSGSGYPPAAKISLATKREIIERLESPDLTDEEKDRIKGKLDLKQPKKVTKKDLFTEAEGQRALKYIAFRENVAMTKEKLYGYFAGDEEAALDFAKQVLDLSKVEVDKLTNEQLEKLKAAVDAEKQRK